MPRGKAAGMSAKARPRLRSSYLLRVHAGGDGCRYELHELRSGDVRSFESLAALQRHLGEAEAKPAAMPVGPDEPDLEPE